MSKKGPVPIASKTSVSGFTLIEMLLVITGFMILLGVIFSLYNNVMHLKTGVKARQIIVEQTYYTMEKLQMMVKDFTIDYNEDGNHSGQDLHNIDTGTNELYLISPDGTQRIYIRRALIESGDRNQDGLISGDNEYRYTLQILKLKGLDAGATHNFSQTSSGVYDGQIDTRVCDASQGFICHGASPGDIYTGYNMPLDENDGWLNLLDNNITLSDRSIRIYPTTNPDYATGDQSMQINPYITIFMNLKLYAKNRYDKADVTDILDSFSFPIQTTFNIKTWYTK